MNLSYDDLSRLAISCPNDIYAFKRCLRRYAIYGIMHRLVVILKYSGNATGFYFYYIVEIGEASSALISCFCILGNIEFTLLLVYPIKWVEATRRRIFRIEIELFQRCTARCCVVPDLSDCLR